MKRKNLKVGLKVVLKKKGGANLNLPAGTVGVVNRLEPEDYTGGLPCRVKFEWCDEPVWVAAAEIRIADKGKAKPAAGEQAV